MQAALRYDASGDAQQCYGSGPRADLLDDDPDFCLLVVDTAIDTSGAACTQVVTQSGGPDLCVMAGTQITVNATVNVIGARALVLVATNTITVAGTLDVSSKRTPVRLGAAANFACPTGTAPTASANGGGGGGGGSDRHEGWQRWHRQRRSRRGRAIGGAARILCLCAAAAREATAQLRARWLAASAARVAAPCT